jgi:hypothetical protein
LTNLAAAPKKSAPVCPGRNTYECGVKYDIIKTNAEKNREKLMPSAG